ncbi:hypothetical protein [Reyranella sp.]|uniref:hypothetical protein n=1 Tax=Reyranella sp. TaxID=1929291 RepID=UPI003BAD9DEF
MVSSLYLTHGLMLLSALAATAAAFPECRGRVVHRWWPALPALLAAVSALALIAYPTWGELKNPGLWMFAIIACVAGVARGYTLNLDVDQIRGLIRPQRSFDGTLAAAAMSVLAVIELVIAEVRPEDQPTMELGLTLAASFLVGRAGALQFRAKDEPHADLADPSRQARA